MLRGKVDRTLKMAAPIRQTFTSSKTSLITYESKTICFGLVGMVSTTLKDIVLRTKTNCFGVMMVYDAFL